MPKEPHQCLKFFVDFGPAFMSTVTEQYKRIQQCIRILIRYGFFIKLSDFYNNHDNDITIVRMHNPEVASRATCQSLRNREGDR